MKNTEDLNFSFVVNASPKEAFAAINNVRGWWIDTIEGSSEKLHDEFTVQFFVDVHYSRQRLVEVVPDTRVTWLVTDSNLSYLKNKTEWNGTKITFDVSRQGDKTLVNFTHVGLTPQVECYGDCSMAWKDFVCNSLASLIATGIGYPHHKQGERASA